MIPTTKKPPKEGFCLLLAEDFDLCAQIWDHSKEPDRVIEFKTGIESGNRITYLYYWDNKPVGEVSLVHHMPDPDHTIPGKRGSGVICLNGAAARKVVVGDTVIIISYALMDFEEAKTFRPSVIFPENNKV